MISISSNRLLNWLWYSSAVALQYLFGSLSFRGYSVFKGQSFSLFDFTFLLAPITFPFARYRSQTSVLLLLLAFVIFILCPRPERRMPLYLHSDSLSSVFCRFFKYIFLFFSACFFQLFFLSSLVSCFILYTPLYTPYTPFIYTLSFTLLVFCYWAFLHSDHSQVVGFSNHFIFFALDFVRFRLFFHYMALQ